MISVMKDILPPADGPPRILCGFNVFGYEDALAVVSAAEEVGAPILLMVNRGMADFMPPEICGPMLRFLAVQSTTPVGVHLDHAWDLDTVQRALESGFTSIMFDGSRKPLAQNIRLSSDARAMTDRFGASLEGEIGTIPYSDMGETQVELTDADQAALFVKETQVDALAVSVGNVHRLTKPSARINFERLAEIEEAVDIPLVIHGASGLTESDILRMAGTRVAKFNIGTKIRQAFGTGFQRHFESTPQEFDRLKIFHTVIDSMRSAAVAVLEKTGWKKHTATA